MLTLPNVIASILTLIPFLAAAFFGRSLQARTQALPTTVRLLRPIVLCIPYAIVTIAAGDFHWGWLLLYALLPVAVATLMHQAAQADPNQTGNWRDFLVLFTLGLAVDLRWFEPAWPPHLAVFNKMLLLNAGIYGILYIRQLDGVGFDLRLRLNDIRIGLRECIFYVPIALVLGLSLGFLHFHSLWPSLSHLAAAYIFTFFFIAVPEELFFRGWMQNLIERRIRPSRSTSADRLPLRPLPLQQARPTLQLALRPPCSNRAGVFYGRAWRQERRVGASAVTHAHRRHLMVHLVEMMFPHAADTSDTQAPPRILCCTVAGTVIATQTPRIACAIPSVKRLR